jgi:alkylation response protein AidB-like acyl-CoA dehydrogenase
MDLQESLRQGVRDLCKRYPDPYWRDLDARRAYPTEFVQALTHAGYLAALIPEQYGGSGLGIVEAAIILEEVNRSGCNSGACHADARWVRWVDTERIAKQPPASNSLRTAVACFRW